MTSTNCLKSINALVDHGHSVILIEHNQEVIKSSDWVIDLGPEGGENGGWIVFEGKPEDLQNARNHIQANIWLRNWLNA